MPDVIEGDGVLEWIAVRGTTRRVVAMPVDTRLVYVGVGRSRPVVGGRWRDAVRAVKDERQQVDTFGHSVVTGHTTDEVQAAVTIERR